MSTVVRTSVPVCLFALAFSLVTTFAHGQGAATSTLSGVVVDSSGAVIPGADVLAKNNATGAEFGTVTREQGTFSLPAIDAGTYKVTVTLTGFKQAVLPSVVVTAATVATVRVTLDVGNLAETIVVEANSSVVQTEQSQIATTLSVNQISNLPLVSRDTMYALTMLPGVDTAAGMRQSRISGLPQGAINITIDGINTQDNNNKSTESLFSLISPRLDAIEEVTVTTAANGADAAGMGAVQIRFVTRSGTNQLRGSAYYYLREPKFNSNYWFNNRDVPPDPNTGKSPKDQVILKEPGFRVGGPIVIPGLFDGHDRAFFFFNWERFYQPNQISRQRTVMNPLAMQGIFQYNAAGGVQQVNVLDLAARNGLLSTIDPTVGKLLADIRAATLTTGGLSQLTDPNLQRFTFSNSSVGVRYYPTVRTDYNISRNNRAFFTTNYQDYASTPDTLNNLDPAFPAFPNVGSQTSKRLNWSGTVRTTLGTNLINEARTGYTASKVFFFKEIGPGAFSGTPVADQGGFDLQLDDFSALSNPTQGRNPSSRTNPTFQVEDTLSWLKGSHSMSFGGSFTHVGLEAWNQTVVPQIEFGPLQVGDPALAVFTGSNFPGASGANITAAGNLYALLTGRVRAINAIAQLDENSLEYAYLGPRVQRGQMHEFGFFAQDAWRVRPDLTINAGLRYELQLPFEARNDSYSTATIADIWGISGIGNLFKPGTLTGKNPEYVRYEKGTRGYNIDYNNFAPNLGFAWRPSASKGLLHMLLGNEGDAVIRGGYSLAYNRNGMGDFTGVWGNNPGSQITANRNLTLGNLGTVPLLFRERNRLGAPSFQRAPVYPMRGVITDAIEVFDPELQVPYAQSWTFGFQRALTRNTAFEVRYVGTRHLQGWIDYNLNEINIKENGFLDEFRIAQQNLKANIAAGRGNTFAFTGAPGTAPLPIILGYFSGVPRAQASDPARYTSTNFTNTTFVNPLAANNPNPCCATGTGNVTGLPSFAFSLYNDATRRNNAINAGLPPNFFIANPDKQGGAILNGNGGYTRYDSIQIELRRRMSKGLLVEGNYVYGLAKESNRYSFRLPRFTEWTTNGIRHALKLNWIYELPFGRNRKFGSNANGFVDRLIGGWEFDGAARIQSGRPLSFGNVRLVGMNEKDLQKMFKLRFDDANKRIYMLPQDVVDNTIKAFSVSATSATGYGALGPPSGRYIAPANGPDCIQVVNGDCAPREHWVTGPMFQRWDLSAVKRIRLVGRTTFEVRGEFLNAFNHVNFIAPTSGQGAAGSMIPNNINNFSQVTSGYRDANNTQDPGGRLVQLVTRITW
jgi:hypothetical protein